MTHAEAIQFLGNTITPGPFAWADLGAGSGVFTLALADLLGPQGEILAIDRSSEVLQIAAPSKSAAIHVRQADFTDELELPPLDGLLMANALHFVRRQENFLRRLKEFLKPGASFLLIEYDNALPNPWVPFPVSAAKFRLLAKKVGLSEPEIIHRRASRYGQGTIYSAICISDEHTV